MHFAEGGKQAIGQRTVSEFRSIGDPFVPASLPRQGRGPASKLPVIGAAAPRAAVCLASAPAPPPSSASRPPQDSIQSIQSILEP